jgi:hypothetical protein
LADAEAAENKRAVALKRATDKANCQVERQQEQELKEKERVERKAAYDEAMALWKENYTIGALWSCFAWV